MRRRKQTGPALEPWAGRTRHPDPRTETQLQQIISLMESVARWEALVGTYRAAIDDAHDSMSQSENRLGLGYAGKDALQAGIESARAREADAFGRIKATEQQIEEAQTKISALMEGVPDEDLAYLYADTSGGKR